MGAAALNLEEGENAQLKTAMGKQLPGKGKVVDVKLALSSTYSEKIWYYNEWHSVFLK
eukprot:NODE_5646_length_305_cov_266.601562_g5034_i0.p1 GENE.NODE_5646_length_305_cov_266.601562_g5034_i0~~NODE_5646_length_305_cov_266.601562_g5034_i0.p1  ORF type:complete len:68 (+),score=30.54 NODE_5646_length_305_cov_266.601562_g5034_i0:32-205(+)